MTTDSGALESALPPNRPTYIFCLSNLAIPVAMAIVRMLGHGCMLITNQDQVQGVLATLYGEDRVTKIPDRIPPVRSSVKKSIRNIGAILKKKREQVLRFADVEGADIYFTGLAFCEFECWLIARLAKKNTIIYARPPVRFGEGRASFGPRQLLYVLVNWVLYGIRFKTVRGLRPNQLVVPDRFLDKVMARRIEPPVDLRAAGSFAAEKFGLPKLDIVLLTGGLIQNGCVEEREHERKTIEIVDLLRAVGKDRTVRIKPHPRWPEAHSYELAIPGLESSVPISLFLGEIQVMIGYYSAALYEAANFGRTAISLLDYYDCVDDEVREAQREYLTSNANRAIHFPKSLEEIEALLQLQ